MAAKLSNLNISRSAVSIGACVDDRNVDPGFSPRFALLRLVCQIELDSINMAQRVVQKRAKTPGDILSAYYSADYTTGYNTGINIRVSGRK